MTFKILSATFLQDGKHSFTLDFTQPESNSQDCKFSLLIGKNGVGKSLILEAIIDFLLYVWVSYTMYSMVRRSKYIFCTTLIYHMNGAVCKLDWHEKRTKSKDDFSVGFVNPSKNEKQNIDGLGLAVLYDKHKDYVMDLIEKSTSYGSLEQNQALSDGFQGLFRTPQEVFDFVWGKYLNEEELENRPLSKLTKDILEQLGIV